MNKPDDKSTYFLALERTLIKHPMTRFVDQTLWLNRSVIKHIIQWAVRWGDHW